VAGAGDGVVFELAFVEGAAAVGAAVGEGVDARALSHEEYPDVVCLHGCQFGLLEFALGRLRPSTRWARPGRQSGSRRRLGRRTDGLRARPRRQGSRSRGLRVQARAFWLPVVAMSRKACAARVLWCCRSHARCRRGGCRHAALPSRRGRRLRSEPRRGFRRRSVGRPPARSARRRPGRAAARSSRLRPLHRSRAGARGDPARCR
jgi:hypothetical protein